MLQMQVREGGPITYSNSQKRHTFNSLGDMFSIFEGFNSPFNKRRANTALFCHEHKKENKYQKMNNNNNRHQILEKNIPAFSTLNISIFWKSLNIANSRTVSFIGYECQRTWFLIIYIYI